LEKATAWLNAQGYSVLKTRQPGGTIIGQQIRRILLNPEHTELQPESELLLYLADRIQHLQELILPAKTAGKIVLCDRFHDSTVAYQGYGRGLNLNSIESIVEHCIKPYAPDLTILLNISPETVDSRLERRQEHAEKDRLDLESLSFFKRVAQGFQELAATEPDRFICINGEQDIEDIHLQIVNILQQRLQLS
jgi:dTMP kinase